MTRPGSSHLLASFLAAATACAAPAAPLRATRFTLAPADASQDLLRGPPQSGGMRSGYVVLKPGEAMHRHSTDENEEQLVFLAGRVRVVMGTQALEMAADEVLYIPPHTEHEVHNDGAVEARYVYTVAPVR